jgi:hypothetical protein
MKKGDYCSYQNKPLFIWLQTYKGKNLEKGKIRNSQIANLKVYAKTEI